MKVFITSKLRIDLVSRLIGIYWCSKHLKSCFFFSYMPVSTIYYNLYKHRGQGSAVYFEHVILLLNWFMEPDDWRWNPRTRM